MTQINKELQKQDPGSALVELYVLEYTSNTFAYFFAGLDEDLNAIQFRDEDGTIRTYAALPMFSEDISVKSDGSMSRPELSIGNVGNTLTNAIGGIDYEDLIGQRITKRSTLVKYLVGEAGDATPPLEFPKQTYVIDRIKERNIISITFELASPFDVAGITLPRRNIIGGSCPFRYREAAGSVSAANRCGGCNWGQKTGFSVTSAQTSESNSVYMNRYDEYIVPSSISFTTFTAGSTSATKGNYYLTISNVPRLNTNGTISNANANNYWQAVVNTSATPSDTSTSWKRVRVFGTTLSSTYYAYSDTKRNEYILRQGNLWQALKTRSNPSVSEIKEGVNWTEGDICGKKIKSCRLRFHSLPHPTVSNGVAIETDKKVILPFGGFPNVRQKR
jgi:lambda family phage minor tail protein L